jgi:hypothetical protein
MGVHRRWFGHVSPWPSSVDNQGIGRLAGMAAPDGQVLSGVGVARITVFDERGPLEPAATAEHAARLVHLGMRAVVVAGSTGEAASLSPVSG